MTSVSAPLNATPALAKERAEHDLAPKSYADAVVISSDDVDDHSHDRRLSMSGTSSTTAVDDRNQLDEDKVIYERHNVSNGRGTLASVRSDESYEEALRHNVDTGPRLPKRRSGNRPQTPLESGRKAGAGWQRSAVIRWAPLNVPVQRRLQTLAVLWHSTAIALFLSFFFFLCAIPLIWPLLVPYLIYSLVYSDESTSGTLRRRSPWMRRSKLWSAFASYFPARLHRSVELEPTRKYIFGYHPHGIISHGAMASFGTETLGFADLFPGITNTLLTLDSNFRIPLYRDYLLGMGLASVSRESIENLLSNGGLNGEGMGRAVTIVVGGATESLEARPHQLKLVLNSRKGFVKLAIRMGADLVPVMGFGENDLYDQINNQEHPWIHKTQLVLKKLMGFTIPLFHARGIFNYDVGLMPYRRAVNIVVGRPVRVVQQGGDGGKVNEDYLDAVHAEYVQELKRLWDEYKDTFARDRESELDIIE